jgi:hypothetical protein
MTGKCVNSVQPTRTILDLVVSILSAWTVYESRLLYISFLSASLGGPHALSGDLKNHVWV